MNDAAKRVAPHHLLFGLAVVLQVALLLYFAPWRLLASTTPISTYDYGLHVYQVERADAAFRQFGHLWSYDPFVLAGQPAGVVEDLTSKSVEVFATALGRLGIPLGFAFNLYIVLAHLGVPFAGWAAARLFGFERVVAAVTALSWVLLWFFDSFLHWCWYVGMISWGASSYLTVLVLALAYRAMTDLRPSMFGLLAVTAAGLTLIHPFSVVTVVLPLALCYVMALRRLTWRAHAMLWGGAALAASTVLVWIGPALRFRHYIGDVDAFMRPTLPYALYDALDLYLDVLMTGQPMRTLLRFTALAGAAVVLIRWRKERDARFWPLFALIGGCVLIAYTSGYLWATRQTQPYRQIGPATLAAGLVASPLWTTSLSPTALRSLQKQSKLVLGFAVLVLAPRFVQTVLQYLPTLLPARPMTSGPQAPPEELPLIVLGHSGPEKSYRDVTAYVESVHHDRGRVVALDWALGEYMATRSTVPVLGGIPQRNVPHVDAHPLHRDFRPKKNGDDPLARYLETYAVGYLITVGAWGPLDNARHVLEPLAIFEEQRVYRVKREPSYFAEGQGRIAAQRLNEIRVASASGARVVLRFHWLETLKCEPNCKVLRVPVPDDRVGFIGVERPPPEFRIYNAYR